MDHNDRREINADTFDIGENQPTPPLTAQRWFRAAMVLLVLAGIAAVVVYTQGDAFMASWYASRAEAKADDGDYQGAIADINHAIKQTPDNIGLYLRRGRYCMEVEPPDLEQAIADFTHILDQDDGYAIAYLLRSTAYQRMAFRIDDQERAAELHTQAIADLERARPHMPKEDPTLLNHLAYSRALAGTDLDEALQEINIVLKHVDAEGLLQKVQRKPVHVNDLIRAREILAYLDTRGFIQHLRGEQEAALQDMELTIDLYLATSQDLVERVADRSRRDNLQQQQDELYSVLLHHRGLVHQALGHEEQAQADLDKAQELGYDPKAGVY